MKNFAELPISAELLERAFRARNGELAWVRSGAIEVIKALRNSDIALLGGEVWLIHDNGKWQGFIPQSNGGPDGVYPIDGGSGWQKGRETWREFCISSADKTLVNLEKFHPEDDVVSVLESRIRYNLTYVTQEEYEELGK